MKNLDEGGTSLLDNSMIMFGGSIKDGNQHTVANLPLLLAGRGKRAHAASGKASARAREDAALQSTSALLNRMGVMENSFGDSTGPLDGLA